MCVRVICSNWDLTMIIPAPPAFNCAWLKKTTKSGSRTDRQLPVADLPFPFNGMGKGREESVVTVSRPWGFARKNCGSSSKTAGNLFFMHEKYDCPWDLNRIEFYQNGFTKTHGGIMAIFTLW